MNYIYVATQSREAKHCSQIKMLTLASGLIALVLVLSFMLKVPQVHAQTSCDYYASPNGTGNGLSPSTPFQISKFWSIAKPGTTLCLLNGTYTDSNSRIHAPTSFAGTASQPITIRALNDGQAVIQSGTERPVDLQGSYGILEGINIHGSDNITMGMRGSYWTARRVVVWNNNLNDAQIVSMGGDHNTLEDCALFGNGRYILSAGAAANRPTYNIIRRCWSRWERRHELGGGGNVGILIGYAGQSNVIVENVLATINAVPSSVGGAQEPPIHISVTQNSQILGTINYAPAGAEFTASGFFYAYPGGGWREDLGDIPLTQGNVLRDMVSIGAPGSTGFSADAFGLDAQPGTNNSLFNLVGVSGQRGWCNSAGWNGCENIRWGTTIAAAIGAGESMWNEVPGICKRYVNGMLTNEPLWPWPMNQRIKDALVQSGRAPVDITQTMEELLGPIPQACTTGAPPPATTSTPRNLRVIGAK